MKSALTHALFFLFEICVFGDAVKAENVSVIEGESVTLHTGVTGIQIHDLIDWRLNGSRIAKISGDPSRTDGVFRGRLELNKMTGDLKITNIKTTDSGEYTLMITSIRGSSEKTFSVSADPRSDGVTVVAVMEGDSVILHTDTEILEDDEILWRFRGGYDIAKMKKDKHFFSTYDTIAGGIFRDRLRLIHQTGNLIISDITSNTSGLYEVDVKKRSTYTIHKAFSVTITDRQNSVNRLNRVSVKEGDPVTLQSGVTKLYSDDLVQWRFEHEVLAKINKTDGHFSMYDGPDGRFRNRLKLDNQNGSLIIMKTRTSDFGLYHLDITGDRHTIFRKYVLSVNDAETWIVAVGVAVGVGVGVLLVAGACGIYKYRTRNRPMLHYR